MAQGYTLSDNGFYFAIQSGFGTQATVLKGADAMLDYEVDQMQDNLDGVAHLGSGFFLGQDVPSGVKVNWRVTFQGSITQVIEFLAACVQMNKGTTTAAGTTGFSHPHSTNNRNSTKKYMTLAFVENETSTGTGTPRIMVRDAVASSCNITIQSGQYFRVEASGGAITSGPGATSTFSFNSNFHIPNISNSANVVTYPTFVPVGFCSTQLNLAYSANLAYAPNCIGSPLASDIVLTGPRWTVSGSGIADSNFATFHSYVKYGTASPTANANQQVAKLQSGALDILLNSDDIIASSSPPTPFSIEFTFPDMQYSDAKFTGDASNVRMGEWVAKSNKSAMTMIAINDLSSASMAI
jgi:hypothetical protein